VSPAGLLAAAAAACGVHAAWDMLAAVEGSRLLGAASRALPPLRALNLAGPPGRPATPPERRRLAMLLAICLLGGGWVLGGPVAGVVLATAGPWVAAGVARTRRRRHRAELGAGAPLVARALADALAGGHSIRGAVVAAAGGGGVPGPAGEELRAAAAALTLGEPTDRVLERLRARTAGAPGAAGRGFELVVAAILLQHRAGGDLARLLRETATAIEDALRLERDARTATAQARFTGLLVAMLPLGAAGLAELGSPGYLLSLLRSPISAWLAGCAAALSLGGLLLVQRLARVRA
jgi:tight adherence protein B